MSNHPNMSYCQWQNTARALEQVAEDYEERLEGAAEETLSHDERKAMKQCFRVMQELLQAADIGHETPDAGESALAMLIDADRN